MSWAFFRTQCTQLQQALWKPDLGGGDSVMYEIQPGDPPGGPGTGPARFVPGSGGAALANRTIRFHSFTPASINISFSGSIFCGIKTYDDLKATGIDPAEVPGWNGGVAQAFLRVVNGGLPTGVTGDVTSEGVDEITWGLAWPTVGYKEIIMNFAGGFSCGPGGQVSPGVPWERHACPQIVEVQAGVSVFGFPMEDGTSGRMSLASSGALTFGLSIDEPTISGTTQIWTG